MGRGRAKAKQTKVARELKYNSPNMDLERLKADLGVSTSHDDAEDDFLDSEYDDDYDEDDSGRR
jgi:hypothetical protein